VPDRTEVLFANSRVADGEGCGERVDERVFGESSYARRLQQLRMECVDVLPPDGLICRLDACFCLAQDAGGESIREWCACCRVVLESVLSPSTLKRYCCSRRPLTPLPWLARVPERLMPKVNPATVVLVDWCACDSADGVLEL